jgi:large subunit ribosomal protein L22e
LTKKFLKKQQLKDYLRVIASSTNSYALKYYKFEQGDDAEDEE